MVTFINDHRAAYGPSTTCTNGKKGTSSVTQVTLPMLMANARAALPIAAWKKLYEIEAKVRDLSDEGRRDIRQAESKPVGDEICGWFDTYKPHKPPSSKLGEATRYLTNNRVALGRFLEDGAIPIDNGIVERLNVRAAPRLARRVRLRDMPALMPPAG